MKAAILFTSSSPVHRLRSVVAFASALTLSATTGFSAGFTRFQFENDVGRSDRYYTQGMRFDHVSSPAQAPRCLERISAPLKLESDDLLGWYAGQLMFTPTNIRDPNPPLTDRPYNGWLYFGAQAFRGSHVHRDTLAASIGTTGRLSGAEFTQRAWHKLWDFETPRGWHTQAPSEPAIDVFVERKLRYRWLTHSSFEVQLLPHVNVNVGTVLLAARAGLTARAGVNIPDDFGHGTIPQILQLISRTPPPDGARERKSKPPASPLGAHLFGTVEAKGVAHSVFLDGAVFHDSRSVEKKDRVYDRIVGAVFSIPGFYLTYSRVHRSKEFERQLADHVFHSVSFTWTR